MAVKVLITRKFKAENLSQAHKFLMELRSLATLQYGYMSGETLISADEPRKVVVISTWVSRKRWEEWQANEKRRNFTKELGKVLERPETTEIFLVGEKVPEWIDMA